LNICAACKLFIEIDIKAFFKRCIDLGQHRFDTGVDNRGGQNLIPNG